MKEDGLFYLGTYGGFDSEGIWENDSYNPKRFFAFYKESELKEIISEVFTIESFRTLPIDGEGPDYYGMILRKK
ncbi:hypothetical protein CIB95_13595 [Lottiidibacillus patelloidae]|uniref:Methyltransferase n=1 Tax=Lottiidibacillus patelloidae TaxID=2670334 RepID=A0A263BRZ1_9BACI|nr:hypothetical protein [Lottiidibacillus patelloidae]OZM56137.1 hypothetical protein CIB95_13595 [Lottiidibacillus patelloidae]